MKTMVLRLSLVDAQQLFLHHLARHGVERCERLVHQQHFRIGGQQPRERDALLHAARQLGGIVILEARELDHVDEALRAAPALVRRDALHLRAELDVAAHRLPRKQRVGLEDHAATRLDARIGLPRSRTSPAVGCMKPANMLSMRRLAAARRAEQAHELALGDIEREALDRDHDLGRAGQPERPS